MSSRAVYGATLIDGTGRDPVRNAIVLIQVSQLIFAPPNEDHTTEIGSQVGVAVGFGRDRSPPPDPCSPTADLIQGFSELFTWFRLAWFGRVDE